MRTDKRITWELVGDEYVTMWHDEHGIPHVWRLPVKECSIIQEPDGLVLSWSAPYRDRPVLRRP